MIEISRLRRGMKNDHTSRHVSELCEKIFNGDHKELPLIASENIPSEKIRKILSHPCGCRTIEGYIGKRYHGGAVYIDELESYTIEKAKELVKAKYANVQPHSCTQANHAAIFALLKPGQKILCMSPRSGGHISHGSQGSITSKVFKIYYYDVDPETHLLSYDLIEEQAYKIKPNLIIAGASSYPRELKFDHFRRIADRVGAFLMAAISHISGLVATGFHQSPVDYAHIISTSTYKTLRGPRGGLLLIGKEYKTKIGGKELSSILNESLFPGIQGTPRVAEIAAKAVCFEEALAKDFKNYQRLVIDFAKTLASCFIKKNVFVISSGTDTHMVLIDCKKSFGKSGLTSESILEACKIILNRNLVPYDTGTAYNPSGVRMGTNSIVTLGLNLEIAFHIVETVCYILENVQGTITPPYFICSKTVIRNGKKMVLDILNTLR